MLIQEKRPIFHIYSLNDELTEIGFLCEEKLIDIQKVKNNELKWSALLNFKQ